MVLTSANSPLQISTLPTAGGGGIGITIAPGKHQVGARSGEHRRDLSTDLDAVAAWDAAAVVTLVDDAELQALRIGAMGREVRRRHMEWHHWPIPDYGVPDAAFMREWPARSAAIRALVRRGNRVLIHCKGGLGRSGMVLTRLMVEAGIPSSEAVQRVRAARPGAIETAAQEEWVHAASPVSDPAPDRSRVAARDRALGALLGLACGDAVGTTLEFTPKPAFAPLDDMVGGGPFGLRPGEWTDDTAMALALAESLLQDAGPDPLDLMRRFVSWFEDGAYSPTGTCFDIGVATRAALNRFARTGDPLAGSTDPASSGNGALMRLAPVALRHWADEPALRRAAAVQSRVTHASPAVLTASDAFARMLAAAIRGDGLATVLSEPAAAIEGGWRGLPRAAIEGSGYVVRSLQAAVWAVARTTDFRSAVLLAANLGDDADTTAAITGQLAGAAYGLSGIPPAWLERLAWRERIEAAGAALFDASWASAVTRGAL